ncbi:MAG: hypothetical protein ACK4VM_13440 [Bosea sp. (in: a-proteobacteria)]
MSETSAGAPSSIGPDGPAPGRADDLAALCEAAALPGRALDLEIFDALGYAVRRKPRHGADKAPAGGLYQDGAAWKPIGRISADPGVAVAMLAELYPNLSWRLECERRDGASRFLACVGEHGGAAGSPALALCAAMLRAHRNRARRSPHQRAARTSDATSRLRAIGKAGGA